MTGLADDVISKWNSDCTLRDRDIKTFIEIVCWLHFTQCSSKHESSNLQTRIDSLTHKHVICDFHPWWGFTFVTSVTPPLHLMAQSFILEILQYKYFYTLLYFSWLPPRVSLAIGYFAEHDIDWWHRSIILLHQFERSKARKMVRK